ncbi:ribosomal protein S6 kinase alpha-5-like [Pomacea canaliculata]|uniref:ribosomal protein S6 kinase alpha-5-like n=1 Tax=Pomacea canaliculata TaxID=400727 RepID=UPI000D737A8D|nr:ribosomal protein S6 kinase alpha-5-like [Pomacea canaliculata]
MATALREVLKLSAGRRQVTMEGQVKVRAEHFDKVSMIGEGTFGKVFLVFKINGWDYGRLYAMKKAKKTEDRKRMDNLLNELKVLKSVREKRFLASLNYAFEDPTHLNFVFDFVNGGDLYTHVSRRGSLCESCVKFYVGELVLALRYLHKLGIVHRDVKLENILIDSSGHVILTDFGFSKFLSSCQIPSSESCGTLRYMAPEAIQAGGHGYPVDWWAVGVVSYELLTGHCPFTAHEDENENYFASIISCLSATRSSLGSLGLSITRCRELDMGLDVSSMQALRPRACKRVRFELDGARPSQDLTEVDQTKVHLDMMAKDQVSNKRCRVDHSFVREVLSFPREVL